MSEPVGLLELGSLTFPPVDGSKQPCPRCHGERYEAEPVDEVGDPYMRCYDCFGDGWQGGGAVSVYASRHLALLVDCPRCGASEHRACIGKANRFFVPGQSCHSDRHRASVAQLQFRDSECRLALTRVAHALELSGEPNVYAELLRSLP